MATMNLTLKVWRQKNSQEKGRMVDYKVTNISDHMSFLEMLDVLNEQLIEKGEEPVAFDHDCRDVLSLYQWGSSRTRPWGNYLSVAYAYVQRW